MAPAHILGNFLIKRKTRVFPYFIGVASYFPQHILYLRPLPHGQSEHIFIPFIIFMVFMVFIDFTGQNRFSTNSIYGTNLYNCNLLSDDKWMTLSTFHLPRSFYHFLLFISNSAIFLFAHWVRELTYKFFIIILYFYYLYKESDKKIILDL